nr:hypothetical protein [Salinispora pacifica]
MTGGTVLSAGTARDRARAVAATVAGIGGALLLLGGAGYLIGRRRTRFLT